MSNITPLAISSARQWLHLVRVRAIKRTSGRIGTEYRIDRGGTYRIFRETRSQDGTVAPCSVLVVGFRLRVIGSNPAMHWLFQRVCLMTTPFWSGFRGFRVKLWMVDPETKNYLGIYEWAGDANALNYVETLVRVLRPISTRNSVWYELYPEQELDSYLLPRKARGLKASPV